jgi:short-subunit dehydrogenase
MKLKERWKGLLGGLAAGCAVAAVLRHREEKFDWNGKVVLITGGSRGLGLALARGFAGRGCRLMLCARDEGELRAAASSLESSGAEVSWHPCDVSELHQVEDLVNATLKRYQRVDVLVNNAGVIQVGPYSSMTLNDFEQAMKVIFWGTVYPTLAVLPHMRERRSGRVVNITSIGGKVSVPHLLPYCCAKFAAVAFSEGLRAELCRTGVKTVTIAPGLMRTGSFLNARFNGDDEREAAWFSVAASLPFLSMSAERAVRQILRATQRGTAEKILGKQAGLLSLFHGVLPGLAADVTGIAGSALPDGQGCQNRSMRPYVQHNKLLRALTVLGQRAARTYLQQTA